MIKDESPLARAREAFTKAAMIERMNIAALKRDLAAGKPLDIRDILSSEEINDAIEKDRARGEPKAIQEAITEKLKAAGVTDIECKNVSFDPNHAQFDRDSRVSGGITAEISGSVNGKQIELAVKHNSSENGAKPLQNWIKWENPEVLAREAAAETQAAEEQAAPVSRASSVEMSGKIKFSRDGANIESIDVKECYSYAEGNAFFMIGQNNSGERRLYISDYCSAEDMRKVNAEDAAFSGFTQEFPLPDNVNGEDIERAMNNNETLSVASAARMASIEKNISTDINDPVLTAAIADMADRAIPPSDIKGMSEVLKRNGIEFEVTQTPSAAPKTLKM